MNINELNDLLKRENRELEFKSTTGEIHNACKTLCAFLNGQGGVVLIGVKNDGRIVGQMVTDPTYQEIANNLRKIEPPVNADVSYISVSENKFVIALDVPAGEHIPYVFDGRPYHRVESETVPMSQHLYEQLLVKRGQLNHAWDEYINDDYTIDDLDHDKIRETVRKGILAKRMPKNALDDNVPNILNRLELLKNGKPKNAAVVLYAKEIISKYFQCMIKLARFKGLRTLDDFIDNQQVCGNAFNLLDEASNFMNKHLNISSTFTQDSFIRQDKFTVPVLAVREAMINAICHRDYQNNSTISLAIFDDRMEIWNSGNLPKQLKLEDLKRIHGSHPRNKLIASTLYKLGYIEKWGNGTLKIFDESRQHGIPEPIFEEYSTGLSVQFIFEEPIGPRVHSIQSEHLMEINKESPLKINIILSIRQSEIVKILGDNLELTALDIMKKLMKPPSGRTLRDDLAHLKKQGIIESRGRGKHAIWRKMI